MITFLELETNLWSSKLNSLFACGFWLVDLGVHFVSHCNSNSDNHYIESVNRNWQHMMVENAPTTTHKHCLLIDNVTFTLALNFRVDCMLLKGTQKPLAPPPAWCLCFEIPLSMSSPTKHFAIFVHRFVKFSTATSSFVPSSSEICNSNSFQSCQIKQSVKMFQSQCTTVKAFRAASSLTCQISICYLRDSVPFSIVIMVKLQFTCSF